ncbi:hypothetical protein CFE70_010049 [Pyrenophora teres f. teres 0-1]|nr:hypothetical protein HRS9139_07920 [Pyrenophora teres f. teres]KAE8832265.1 hypothetical protein PTNB85_06657 [Pyrenophora teres f. teres]KAE8837126.1 hypothetical protein HRS9122_07281 [Pyrenophora teres f. teres]KAE8855927.1 hypothetical protein PTNB29_08766 [Pyrenophora teres f. teres]KAE8860422.1 hypothetical protein PTNB73_08032 [Pyrenophora teres f. teres]
MENMATPEMNLDASSSSKRRKLSTSNTDGSKKSNEIYYFTPPITPDPPVSVVPTTTLKVTVPERQVTPEEQRRIKLRVAAARRWVPKLQTPFPKNKEIREAYQYKLMRHYTDGQPQVPVIRPQINTSPRVDALRKRFPLLKTPQCASSSSANLQGTRKWADPKKTDSDEIARHQMLLQRNKQITQSPIGQKLAWEAFSSREQDRMDRGREALMLSGLWDADLEKEERGQANNLPEWRKAKTSQFANGQKLS